MTGRREAKRQETRDRLARAAEALFLERGFDATTVDEIAAAAGVSRRSFFHHFATKEDVVFAHHADFEAALLAAIATQPPGEPLLRVTERAIAEVASYMDRTEALALTRLKHATPALHARNQANYERLERVLATALAERLGTSGDALRARLVAMVMMGTIRVAAEFWREETLGDETPEAYARRVFRTLWRDLIEGSEG